MHSSSQGRVNSTLRSNQPSGALETFGISPTLRLPPTPQAVPRKRTSIQPSVLVVVWTPMRRRATIPVTRTVPRQHLGVLIRIDEQRRRGDSVQQQVCCRFSHENLQQFHERNCHILQRETGEVHCQYFNTQIQILVGLQTVVVFRLLANKWLGDTRANASPGPWSGSTRTRATRFPVNLRLPVRRSITCFLLRCQHAWRLQSATTSIPARRVSRQVTMM